MRIIVAEHSGFCFGVQRAVSTVEEALLESSVDLFTFGELIHNKNVVNALCKIGATPIYSMGDVPKNARLVIRAHGAPPQIYDEANSRDIRLIDATCPFVTHVHEIVSKYHSLGYLIIIVGDAHHPEVIGIKGWAISCVIVSNEDDARAFHDCERACIVAQTTLAKETFDGIVSILSKKIGELKVFNTICKTTLDRQKEAVMLAKNSDAVIVIGSKHSSNTQKLANLCSFFCKNTVTVEDAGDSALEIIHNNDIISIVAGASTPNCIIMEVVTRMSELENNVNEAVEEKAPESIVEVPAEVSEKTNIETAAEADEPSFSEAIEMTLRRIHNGQVLTGTIVQIADEEVCVNIGYKSDGFIPRNEFSSDPDVLPSSVVSVGDEIEVEVLKVNDGEGNVLLSHKSVEAKKAWDDFIEQAEAEDTIFETVCKEVVKSGLIAYINGVRAFIPASHVSNRYVENLGEFVGKPMRLKIISIDKAKKRVVASQKEVLKAEAALKKHELWSKLEVGAIVKGVVRRLTDFGAFVDIGGIDGLAHVTELAWGRVKHPSDVLKIGSEINVIIKNVDIERERVSLGYKELLPKPWTTAAERYPVGSAVEGKVVRIVTFGAFVSLEPTIDGLVHISQVATKRIEKVEDELKIGDMIKCKVLSVDPVAKRISLSRREVLLDEVSIEDIVHATSDGATDTVADEDAIEIPPVETATTSLADFFPKMED